MKKGTFIEVKNARVHNLKNFSVQIPHNQLTVITGLSGSGKSSLAFDTLFAEGQRRYIESLSSYARQFLGKLNKPEADYIKGLSPAIAIQQKVISSNPRSTVGTTTEIYDYLKILFARVGRTYDPESGEEVTRHDTHHVVDHLLSFPNGTRFYIACPIAHFHEYGVIRQLDLLRQQGYVRLLIDEKVLDITTCMQNPPPRIEDAQLLVDRIVISEDPTLNTRLSDSVQIAFQEGKGDCIVYTADFSHKKSFSNRFELNGNIFQEPSEHFFAFNNPFGACKTCEGYGQILGINPDLVFPNRNLTIYEGAIAPWRSESMREYLDRLIMNSPAFQFPIHRPIHKLSAKEYQLLWEGNDHFTGLNNFFKFIESQTYKIQYRVMLSRYRGKTVCPDCLGTRLRKDASYVKINGASIVDLVLMPVEEVLDFFRNLKLHKAYEKVSKRILPEIINRLSFLCNVGLGYLTLNRTSNSLSGGESQRIQLATSLGSSLVGSMYILDEPSIGLHPHDTGRLIRVLEMLRNEGNTVIVVEHEEEIIRAADYLVDIGPKAGSFGGELVFCGSYKQLTDEPNGLTSDYLLGRRSIPLPAKRRKSNAYLHIQHASKNNLEDVSVSIPLHQLVCITGVSGSGKSTLIKEILFPALQIQLGEGNQNAETKSLLSGEWKSLSCVEMVDQHPIGKSSRSNPITYVKAFDDIRELYARQPIAKQRGYKPGFFSFNVEGGRCEMCEGEGEIKVSMQFMADVQLVCETCQGTRYKEETREILLREKSICDILQLDIASAYDFFNSETDILEKKIREKMKPLLDVGLGYLKVGQSSSTLSGGEAQRIKLASFLSKGAQSKPTLFIFDEPTTGLHFYDVEKLLCSFQALLDKGHSVVVIEHNLDVIKSADWIIDMGPGGGANGGRVMFSGIPEELIRQNGNLTGLYLKQKLMLDGSLQDP